jgi:hypothetical protein
MVLKAQRMGNEVNLLVVDQAATTAVAVGR